MSSLLNIIGVARALRRYAEGRKRFASLGGFVFCTPRVLQDRAAWETTLRSLGRIQSKPQVLKCGEQDLEWVSAQTYRRRTGHSFNDSDVRFGAIAAVKLFCADLSVACQRLSAEGFVCVRRWKPKAMFAADENTGFAFELVQRSPEEFMAALAGGG